jgi:hypothetical protein
MQEKCENKIFRCKNRLKNTKNDNLQKMPFFKIFRSKQQKTNAMFLSRRYREDALMIASR